MLAATYLTIHEPAWHQYGIIHYIDSFDKLLHHIDNAVFGELLLIVTCYAAQAVPETERKNRMLANQLVDETIENSLGLVGLWVWLGFDCEFRFGVWVIQ